MSLSLRRSGAAALAVTVLASLFLFLQPGPAEAAAYRYWGYYTWTEGAWTFATTGPDETSPADGAVEGWRFAVATESFPRVPRATGDFDAICAASEPAAGKKRVAVVLDSGLPDDAPDGSQPPPARGACALVDESASGAQVLAAVSTARIEGGLVCAIDDYPAQGCGQEVETEPPASPDAQVSLALPEEATDDAAADGVGAEGGDGGTPWAGIAIGALLVAALGGAAAWKSRSGPRS